MKKIITSFVLALNIYGHAAAQTVIWDIDKRLMFPDSPYGLDVYGGDSIDLDGNPNTLEYVIYDFNSPTWHYGMFQTIALRNGIYCRGNWFNPNTDNRWAWFKFEKYNGITRLIMQTSWNGEHHIGVSLNVPTCQ